MLLLCRGYRALIELLGLGVLALYCVSCRLAAEADVVASLLVGTGVAAPETPRDRPISRFCGGAGAPALAISPRPTQKPLFGNARLAQSRDVGVNKVFIFG